MFCAQGVEKVIVSKLLVDNSNRRIYNVDRHAGAVSAWHGTAVCEGRTHCPCPPALQAVAGLAPDGRMIVNRAMEEATNYKR